MGLITTPSGFRVNLFQMDGESSQENIIDTAKFLEGIVIGGRYFMKRHEDSVYPVSFYQCIQILVSSQDGKTHQLFSVF